MADTQYRRRTAVQCILSTPHDTSLCDRSTVDYQARRRVSIDGGLADLAGGNEDPGRTVAWYRQGLSNAPREHNGLCSVHEGWFRHPRLRAYPYLLNLQALVYPVLVVCSSSACRVWHRRYDTPLADQEARTETKCIGDGREVRRCDAHLYMIV